MAYATGVANSVEELLTALRAACTSSGWTAYGEVLAKNGCYTRLYLSGTEIRLQGGTGMQVDGLTLDGASANVYRIANMAFPVSYEAYVHSNPDEVYFIVNGFVDAYAWLAFGQSPTAGNPGFGQWFGAIFNMTASIGGSGSGTTYFGATSVGPTGDISGGIGASWQVGALFWKGLGEPTSNADINTGLDGVSAWTRTASALDPAQPLAIRQPNAWNGEATLVPIEPIVAAASSKVCRVGSLGHARYLRIDNLLPGDLITLGPDRWKVYPWQRKNAGARNGAKDADHTGTFGWAIRYDGP